MIKKSTVWAKKGLFDPSRIPRATSLLFLTKLSTDGFGVQDLAQVETGAATGLVEVFFSEHDGFLGGVQPIGVHSEVAAVRAYSMYFGDVFRYGHQAGHRAEGLPSEVHIQPGHDYPDAAQGELLAVLRQFIIEELRFIYPADADTFREGYHLIGMLYRSRVDRVGIVRNDVGLGITPVNLGLEDFNPLIGYFGPF